MILVSYQKEKIEPVSLGIETLNHRPYTLSNHPFSFFTTFSESVHEKSVAETEGTMKLYQGSLKTDFR